MVNPPETIGFPKNSYRKGFPLMEALWSVYKGLANTQSLVLKTTDLAE
jgi:hypothetical protein